MILSLMSSQVSAQSSSDLFTKFAVSLEKTICSQDAPIHHTVYLVSPPDDSYTSQDNNTLQFTYNHTGYLSGVVNCTLYLDGAAINYTTNVNANINTAVLSNSTIEEGRRYWWVNCTNGTDSESSIDIGWNFTLNIDTTSPSIDFTARTDADSSTVNRNWTYINTSVYDAISPGNTTSLIDFNRTLVLWMRFNKEAGENDTHARDWSSWGNNGTLTNMNLGIDNCTGNCSGWTSSGKFGKALNFDGKDDYVDAGNAVSLQTGTGAFTEEAWVKWNDLTGEQHIASKAGNRQLFKDADNFLYLGSGSTGLSGVKTVVAGVWYHIVGVYNGTKEKIYINGVEDLGDGLGGVLPSSDADNLIIGAYTATPDYLLNGTIDEVRIYSRALGEDEINASYNTGLYRLYHNFTNLTDGTYTYTAYAQDLAGNVNQTETRTLTVDTTPTISFIAPTPGINNYTSKNWTYINTSVYDAISPGNTTSLMDFNRSLVLWMRFNKEAGENDTHARDWSSWGNNGTMTNMNLGIDNCTGSCSGWTTSGKFGDAMMLDGVDDEISFGSGVNFVNRTQAITVEAWIYPVNYTGHGSDQHYLVAKTGWPDTGWWFHLRNGGTVAFINDVYGIGYDAASSQPVPLNQWSHVTGWSNGTMNKVFINGVESGSISTPELIDAESIELTIGADALDYAFNGTIDEVRIYSRALGDDEINASYNVGLYRLYHNFTNLTDGTYTYIAYAQDISGDVAETESRTLYIDTVPPTRPVLFSPANNTNSTDITPDLDWTTVAETNFGNYTIQVDNDPSFTSIDYTYTAATITESNYTVSSGWSDALWYWRVIAYDIAGNTNTSSYFAYTIDTTPPLITILSPLNQTYGTAPIWFNITLNESGNWSGYSLDGASNVTLTNTSGNWNNLSTAAEGFHNITFYANDTLGNMANSTTVYFTIDITPPLISNRSSSATSTTATIIWTTSENTDAKVNLGTTTALGTYTNNTENTTSHSVSLSGLSPGTAYYYNMTSCDLANNCNTTGPDSFTTTASSGSGSSGSGKTSNIGLPQVLHECENNTGCTTAQTCKNYKCVDIRCASCEYIKARQCAKYECCKDIDCIAGHTCKNNICKRLEEPKPDNTSDTLKIEAEQAISTAKNIITLNKPARDTKEAENLLEEAESAFSKNNYSQAKELAYQAKLLAENTPALEEKETTEVSSNLPLMTAAMIILVLIIIFCLKRYLSHRSTVKYTSKDNNHKLKELEEYIDKVRPLITRYKTEGRLDDEIEARLLEVEAEKNYAKQMLKDNNPYSEEQLKKAINMMIGLKNDIEKA